MILESMFLVVMMYMLFCFLFYKENISLENVSPYECGFDPYSSTRLMFSYRFYLISILFIIFDVEISLMLPTPFLIGTIVGLMIFVIFVFIMIMGLMYEYYCGSLDWLNHN